MHCGNTGTLPLSLMKSHSGMQTKSDTNNTHRGTVRAVLDQGNAEADALKQTAQTQTGGQQTDQK